MAKNKENKNIETPIVAETPAVEALIKECVCATVQEKPKFPRDEKTGKINWFKMIPQEYLYLNEQRKNQIEKRLGKSYLEVTKDEALETELIINLAGIRWLLDTLGFSYSRISPIICSPDYAAASCEICFNASEHNNYQPQIYSQSASAHPGNTKSWYKEYLVEAAGNRAFCRAVRFYCNVQCVSADELGTTTQIQEENPNSSPASNPQVELLQTELDIERITWAQFQSKLIKDNVEGAADMKSLSELPKDKIFEYLERLKAKRKAKAAK